MYKVDLETAKESEIKLPTSVGSLKKQGNYRKSSTSTSLTTLKHLTVWITTNCGKFFKRWEHQTTLSCLLRNLCAGKEATVRTGHGTTDWFQIGKGVCQGCILSPCLFYIRVHHVKCPARCHISIRLMGEIAITSDMQMTSP